MKMRNNIPIVCILSLMLIGCDEDPIPVSLLQKTQWYCDQVKIVQEKQSSIIHLEQIFLCGKIISLDNSCATVTLSPFRKLAGYANCRHDAITLWFGDLKRDRSITVGDWIVARAERSLKNQFFVKDCRVLSQMAPVPDRFADDYEKVLLTAIARGWHLKVEILEDGRLLKTINNAPQENEFYALLSNGEYEKKRSVKGRLFKGNTFEFTIKDMNGFLSDRVPMQNTPGEMIWQKDKNEKLYTLRCSYDFNSDDFRALTGENPKISVRDLIRFSAFRESAGIIAMHPATQIRKEELQKAFQDAGIHGEWKIGDFGSMIFYSDCSEFELDMPWLLPDRPLHVIGPNRNGFIFSLSRPHKGYAHIPVISHSLDSCGCQKFYYWKIKDGPRYLHFGNGENMVWHTWDFEFGENLAKHDKILAEILQTLRKMESWSMPERIK